MSHDDDNDSSGDGELQSSATTLRDRYGNFVHQKVTTNVSRIQYMSPDQGDIWFLRLLLLHRPADSFLQLRSINGFKYETYEQYER